MTDFVSTWNEESFLTTPVGPLGLIAMRGTEEIAGKVNQWLLKWRQHSEATMPGDMTTTPGMGREDFLVRTTCPRFGNGEGKGLIKDSVRGLDLYILCDVGAYNCTYDMYGQKVPMSPDDHYMDLKRTIAAVGGKAKRITVIMPMLYGGRQHRRSSRESLDCALMLQELCRMGVSNIITFDAHDPRVQNAIPEGGFESVMPSYQIFKALLKKEKTLNLDKDHLMIVSPDDHYMDLKRTIAAVGGKAKRITVIMPMLYGGRQHRRASRESLDCAMMLQELERMGVNNIITFDAHDPRVQNAIPEGGFESVMPSYQIFKALLKKEKTLRLDKDHLMIVSPDEGALDRNIFYASVLGVDMGMFYKRRDYTRIVNGRNPIIAHEYMGSDLDGKDVFVADDILSSGESMIDVARNLKGRNANRIFAAVTFPLFTNGLDLYNKAYEEGLIDGVISTNLTYRTPELQAAPWFIEADMSKYISYIIATLNHDRSLSRLLSPSDRINALKERYEQEQIESGFKLV